jgi:hypothetical protein
MKVKQFQQPALWPSVLLWLLFLVLLFSDQIAGYYIKKKFLNSKNLNAESVKINVFLGTVYLYDIYAFIPDTANATDYTIHIAAASIKGISFHRLLTGSNFSIGAINLHEPHLTLYIKKIKQVRALRNEISWIEKKLDQLEELNIYNGSIKYSSIEGDSLVMNIPRLQTGLIHPSYWQKRKIESVDNFLLSGQQLSYYTSRRLYVIKINNFLASSEKNSLTADSISIVPLYSKQEFDNANGYQTDRIDAAVAKTEIHFRNIFEPVFTDSVYAQLLLSDGYITAYRDKRMPRKPRDFKKTVQEYLQDATANIHVDSVIIKNFTVKYEEQPEQSQKPGSIIFEKFNARISNLNTGELAGENLTIVADGKFMNAATADIRLEFPYAKNYFDCRGTIKNLPFKNLNRISEPNGFLVFTTGKLNRMDFNFRAADSSRGDLLMLYNDLEFAVADKKDGDTSSIKSHLISFVASEILISENNPSETDTIYGVIAARRNKERFIFNYIFQSIVSGVQSTVIKPKSNVEKVKKKRRKLFGKL